MHMYSELINRMRATSFMAFRRYCKCHSLAALLLLAAAVVLQAWCGCASAPRSGEERARTGQGTVRVAERTTIQAGVSTESMLVRLAADGEWGELEGLLLETNRMMGDRFEKRADYRGDYNNWEDEVVVEAELLSPPREFPRSWGMEDFVIVKYHVLPPFTDSPWVSTSVGVVMSKDGIEREGFFMDTIIGVSEFIPGDIHRLIVTLTIPPGWDRARTLLDNPASMSMIPCLSVKMVKRAEVEDYRGPRDEFAVEAAVVETWEAEEQRFPGFKFVHYDVIRTGSEMLKVDDEFIAVVATKDAKAEGRRLTDIDVPDFAPESLHRLTLTWMRLPPGWEPVLSRVRLGRPAVPCLAVKVSERFKERPPMRMGAFPGRPQ
jgi:hypothetical protein